MYTSMGEARLVYVCEVCGETLSGGRVEGSNVVGITPCPCCIEEAEERGRLDILEV